MRVAVLCSANAALPALNDADTSEPSQDHHDNKAIEISVDRNNVLLPGAVELTDMQHANEKEKTDETVSSASASESQ